MSNHWPSTKLSKLLPVDLLLFKGYNCYIRVSVQMICFFPPLLCLFLHKNRLTKGRGGFIFKLLVHIISLILTYNNIPSICIQTLTSFWYIDCKKDIRSASVNHGSESIMYHIQTKICEHNCG